MKNYVNETYEKIILGCMISDNTLIDIISGKISKDVFYTFRHQAIFDAILSTYLKDEHVDLINLSSVQGLGAAYIASLTDYAETSNYAFYVDEVKNLYLTRKAKNELSEKAANLSPDNILDTIHDLNSHLVKYMDMDSEKPTEIKDMCVPFIEELQKPKNNDSPYLGVDTGWENLSTMIDGIRSKKLYIIGARPSIGKSALGLQLIKNTAAIGVPSCMFSFEMPREELMVRTVALESGVPAYNIEHKMFSNSQIQRINTAVGNIFNLPLSIYDEPVENEKKLYSMIRVEAMTKHTKVFLIDHLGLIRHSNRELKRFEAVHDITITLHELAKELDVSIIVLCQLKRDAEGRKPCMSDLRESGDIEQDADVIMFIHRDRIMNNESEVPTKIIVEKNRGGSTGEVDMIFLQKLVKFIEGRTEKEAA